MMSLTFGLFTQVSGLGPLGPLVGIAVEWKIPILKPKKYGISLGEGTLVFSF